MLSKSLRIAIADDEVDMRDFLCKVLPHLGYEVVAVAGDGNQLMDECRRTCPDLVITDIKMPHRDGLSAIEELWRDRKVPVIFISAYPQEMSGWLAHEPQLTTVLTKPVKRSDLELAILQTLSRNSAS